MKMASSIIKTNMVSWYISKHTKWICGTLFYAVYSFHELYIVRKCTCFDIRLSPLTFMLLFLNLQICTFVITNYYPKHFLLKNVWPILKILQRTPTTKSILFYTRETFWVKSRRAEKSEARTSFKFNQFKFSCSFLRRL